MKVNYTERGGLKVVPKYEGTKPVGFDIENIRTGEVVSHFTVLHEAEEYINNSGKVKRPAP